MQIVLISHPSFRLSANLALHTLLPPGRHQSLPLGAVLGEILRNEAALSQHHRLHALTCTRGGDADDGRLSQRVHLLKLWRGKLGLFVAAEHFQSVWQLELLQQPENAL